MENTNTRTALRQCTSYSRRDLIQASQIICLLISNILVASKQDTIIFGPSRVVSNVRHNLWKKMETIISNGIINTAAGKHWLGIFGAFFLPSMKCV